MTKHQQLFAILLVIISGFIQRDGKAQEPVMQTTGASALSNGPFALGEANRKPLPSLDSWHCRGPAAFGPCNAPCQSYLYFNTGTAGDVCAKDGGDFAVRLSRCWIGIRQRWTVQRGSCCDSQCSACSGCDD